MELLKPEQINKIRKDQTREIVNKNERLVTSLKRVLKLQNDIDFDQDKAKKVKDYEVWCKDLQDKMSKELSTLKAYQKLTDDKKEEYYNIVARVDALQDKELDLKESIGRLELQVKWLENSPK